MKVTVKFLNEEDIHLVSLYTYSSASEVGKTLSKWLLNKKIVDGVLDGLPLESMAYGVGCLAAQFIRDHKTTVGEWFITEDTDSEEIQYVIMWKNKNPIIIAGDFEFSPQQLLDFLEN